ncbi:MAG TPA: hypothetical protein VFX43_07015 [Chitinophagaceae bacterium]|nr:hypothetical protein [Chitinophagaceae bacterium]
MASNIRKNLTAAIFWIAVLTNIAGCIKDTSISSSGKDNGKGICSVAGSSFITDPGRMTDSLIGGRPRLGVNYNGQFDFVDFEDLGRTETRWVRGFIDFFQFYDKPSLLQSDPRILNYLRLKDHGYKTILNIKWNFSQRNFPDTAGPEMRRYTAFLTTLLNRVWSETDLIVVGNEPFIESKVTNRGDSLVQFYEKVAHDVENFETHRKHLERKPIFIGAFNNLYLSSWQTNSVEKLLAFAKSDPWIGGVDLHIHHNGINQLKVAMNAVKDQIRADQKIIVTEFSLVKYFKAQLDLAIPKEFADAYHYGEAMKNYQYIDRALKDPVSQKEWEDFLSSSSWFETRKHYLRNAFDLLKTYPRFAIATYAMRQSFPPGQNFTAGTMPWILNALYANRTVRMDPGSPTPFNYAWINDFVAIQDQ